MSDSPLVAAAAHTLFASLPADAGLTADDVAGLLGPPRKPEMGDLSFPCFKMAKALKAAPPKIAADVVAQLTAAVERGEGGVIATAEAAGPYVNLRLDPGGAAGLVLPAWARGDEPAFDTAAQRVMVEYSQPNTHKAFHVGHMRNVCLGDALVRILRAAGHTVIAANYFGDVGTHIAKCLWGYLHLLTDEERTPPAEGRGEWLGRIYARSSTQLDDWKTAGENGDADAQARYDAARTRMTEILRQVEARDPELSALWDETRQWSLEEFAEIYDWCDVHFDRLFYESEVDEPGLKLVDDYLAKGVFHESDGAIGIENPEVKHMPFFMLRKRDGTGLYSTKDLALAEIKFREFEIDRSIYVVDVRQSDHFRHVFLSLEKMGFEQAEQCEHVGYEMVELPDGAMAGRKGNVVLFRSLREQISARLRDDYFAKYVGEWPEQEIEAAVHQVALGAIKFGMLERDVNQKIVFDMPEWLKPEGKTGVYLQYVTARTASLLRKADERGKALDPAVLEDGSAAQKAAAAALVHEAERALVNHVAELPRTVAMVAESLRPSVLVTALYELARAYNSFQNNRECGVIDSDGDLLQGRLLLVTATRSALRWGLGLLGIPAPERM